MKSAERNKAEGKLDKVTGRAREAWGKLSGNKKADAKGKAKRGRGVARRGTGQLKKGK
jgi:uncharacterized protein YjbJ (UPF0337 family)